MIIEKFPFLFNNISIMILGDNKERFINLCRNKDVCMWNLRISDDGIICMIKRKQFAALRPICRITGCRVKILKKQGIKYAAFKYRKHYSFIIGIMIAALIIKWVNMYVWDIEFSGNNMYSDQYINNYLASIGIENGIHIRNIDCEWLEHKIREDFDEVTWASVSVSGTKVMIAIKENDGTHIQDKEEIYGDICSSDDGIVESVIVRSGTPMVKKGDEVTKGQVLVSGQIVISDAYGEQMEIIDTQVDADVLIRTEMQYNDCIYRNYKDKEYTDKKRTTYIIDAYGKEITLLKRKLDDNWDIVSDEINPKLFGKISLPVRINIVRYNQYITNDRLYEDEQMEQILNDRFDSYIKNLQNSVQILDNDVKIIKEDGYYEMSGVIHIISPSVQYGTYSRSEDLD